MLDSNDLKKIGEMCEINQEFGKIYHSLLEERSQVLESVNYQLKNYFTLIMSNVQLMETKDEDLLEDSHWLQMVGNINKMYELLEQFSIYTVCDEVELKTADVQALVQNVFQHFHAISIMKELDLKLEIAEDTKEICKAYVTNYSKLREILVNLVKNAVETAKVSSEIRVAVEKNKEDTLKISVINNRTMIEMKQKEDIFKPKFDSENGRSKLELLICAKFAAVLGGRIEVDSTEKETRFQIILPIAD